MKIKFALSLILLCVFGTIQAAKTDTVAVRSNSMNKEVQVVVISPDNRTTPKSVIYLLHGHGGQAKSWLELKPELAATADRDDVIFVCPDGKNSWYLDSSKNPAYLYETFVSEELTDYIDTNYPTRKDSKNRAIAGLSMGGHGAMWIAMRHKDKFGAAGSMSGGLDIRPFPKNWNMSEQLGEMKENPEIWDAHTVINQIPNIENGDLALIIDCGYDDFFFAVNEDFHQKLTERKIDHDYYVRPGGHNGNYWKNAIDYQILFFNNFFNKNK